MYYFVRADQRPVQEILPCNQGIIYIAWERGQYLDIVQEGGFYDPHFDL